MKKMIVVLACLLLLAAGVPLFAHGPGSGHGRFHKDNSHRWQGSDTHPASHGYHGWGSAPSRCPGGVPTPDPTGNPPDHPGNTPVGQPGDKPDPNQPQSDPGKLFQPQVLDLSKGSVIG